MFEMKYSLLAIIIITIILGTSMYYSERGNNGVDGNLRAGLPLPTEVSETEAVPLFAGNAEPQESEETTEVITLAAANDNIEAAIPMVEGTITEEAATDSQILINEDDTDETQGQSATVPLTAQTGANALLWLVAALSLMAGGFGLMLLPVAAARG
jgi:hypothetical protein